MNIEIKKSIKPINYFSAIDLLEKRLEDLYKNKDKELIWILEHDEIFTAGTSYKENEILDNSINLIKTNRGGKITCHSPGQLICYFVLDLRKKKDIRKFISCIEKSIIETLKDYKIETFSDKDNVGIWYKKNHTINKVAAIGIRVKKWIAYHGFAININNNLNQYKKIVTCGLDNKMVTSIYNEKKSIPKDINVNLSKIFIKNLNKI